MTLFDKLERFPPILIRILARMPHGRPLSTTEIADSSGLPHSTVDALSSQTDWRGIDIPTAMKFMRGCRVDLTKESDYRRVQVYIKSANGKEIFPFLRRSPDWSSYYMPLLIRYNAYIQSVYGK